MFITNEETRQRKVKDLREMFRMWKEPAEWLSGPVLLEKKVFMRREAIRIGLDWYKLGKGRQRSGNDQQAHGKILHIDLRIISTEGSLDALKNEFALVISLTHYI